MHFWDDKHEMNKLNLEFSYSMQKPHIMIYTQTEELKDLKDFYMNNTKEMIKNYEYILKHLESIIENLERVHEELTIKEQEKINERNNKY